MRTSLSTKHVILAGLLLRSFQAILLTCLLVALTASAESQTPAAYDDITTPEGWAWSQIKQGLVADFNDFCGIEADSTKLDHFKWLNACRTISADFIVNLLTARSLHDAIKYKGVALVNARISGTVDLRLSTIDRPLSIVSSLFDSAVKLDNAHANSAMTFRDSFFMDGLSGISFRSDTDIDFTRTTILGDILLDKARINGDLIMSGANFKDDLKASEIEVHGSLLMLTDGGSKASFKNVALKFATVTGPVNMLGATLNGDLDAEGLRVGASLFMSSEESDKAIFRNVLLLNAETGKNVELVGTSVTGRLNASGLKVGGSLLMHPLGKMEATFKDIYMVGD